MSNIRDVAKLAGVSVATVSRVLNNDQTYKIKDDTRHRVWQAVAQCNYRLPGQKQKRPEPTSHPAVSVGCLMCITRDKYQDPYYMSILSGIEQSLDAMGYSMSFVTTYGELKDKNTLYELFKAPPKALILMETLDPDTYSYVRARVPYCVGIDTHHTDIDNIGYDHFAAAFTATQHLIRKGHQRIGFIGGSGLTTHLKGSRRYWGYRCAMEMEGLPIREEWIRNSRWEELQCMEQARALMELPEDQRPTAIFAASDLMAIATLSVLYSMNISIPDQIAVMGLSNIEMSRFSSPPLSTLDIPAVEIGKTAVRVLEQRLKGSNFPPETIYMPATLLIRDST